MIRALVGILAAALAGTASAQAGERIIGARIGVAAGCSYFGEELPEAVTTFRSDTEAEQVIEDIVDLSGLEKNFRIRAAGVPNAAAVIDGANRFILYSQHFMRDLEERTGSTWAPKSVMAHEVGHHLNGHTLHRGGSQPNLELEADFYSGFTLQRMGATLAEARLTMEKLGNERATATHPAKRDRLAAITNGWIKSCEKDPRCTRGHAETAQPRPAKGSPASAADSANSCESARDGECDEPLLCESGTDTADCAQKTRGKQSPASQGALFCCDPFFGIKMCLITMGSSPPGTGCFCMTGNVGVVCQ